jgi:hypothetical protein
MLLPEVLPDIKVPEPFGRMSLSPLYAKRPSRASYGVRTFTLGHSPLAAQGVYDYYAGTAR